MIAVNLRSLENGEVLHIQSAFQLLQFPIKEKIKSALIFEEHVTVSYSKEDNLAASYIYLEPRLFQSMRSEKDIIYLNIEFENGANFNVPLKLEYSVTWAMNVIHQKRIWIESILKSSTHVIKKRPSLIPDPACSAALKTDHVSTHENWRLLRRAVDDIDSGFGVDIGAGVCEKIYGNIVNIEIFDYPSTDVIAYGDNIPIKQDSFDFAICLAVLEHVPNPFDVAAEIQRIVKPGGQILIVMPFLQHVHGYPYHFFNATTKGAEQLFNNCILQEHFQDFSCHPIRTLRQVITDYFRGLAANDSVTAKKFLDLKLSEIAGIEQSRDEKFLNVSEDCMNRIAHANFSVFKVK